MGIKDVRILCNRDLCSYFCFFGFGLILVSGFFFGIDRNLLKIVNFSGIDLIIERC